MMTLRQLSEKPKAIPTSTSWYLADLSEARGKQELFTRQSPQKLKALREHALIESAVSSNRIEGVVVDKRRIGTLVFGKPLLRDRNEEEIRGYRDALKLLHEQNAKLPISETTIRELHRLTRGEIWDAGKYKQKDTNIIERSPDGRHRVRFKTISAAKTPDAMRKLVNLWDRSREERASQTKEPRGTKTELIEAAIHQFTGDFTLSQLEQGCLGVSPGMVRKVLRNLQKDGKIECLGRGPGALWRRKGNINKGG